jgi:site-specific DNA recombinase
VIYARQSKDATGEGQAVERQVEACRALVEARGWTEVADPIVDNDLSASSGKRRPGYERAVGLMQARSVDVVVVWALDRFVRRLADLEDVVRLVEGTGARIATVTGDLDLSTDTGRLVGRILASVAQGEVERKGTRQRLANRQRAEQGVGQWTRRPFAYDRGKGVRSPVVVVEREAEGLRAAVDHVLAGGTLAAAVRDLDARGLATTAGKPFNVTTLRRILLNPRYAGTLVHNGRDGTVTAAGHWPVLITDDERERLIDVLADPSRRVQQGTELRYWLSGALTCGRCGDPMYASPMGPTGARRMVYRCRTGHLARRLDLVDARIESLILGRLAMPDAARLISEREDVSALRARATELRQRRDDLAAMLADGLMSATAVRERAEGLTADLRDVESRIGVGADPGPLGSLVTAEDVEATWRALSVRDRRAVADDLVSVTVLPQGKGGPFDPDAFRAEWRTS